MDFHVKDLSLSPSGRKKIEWAKRRMPVLNTIRERLKDQKTLKGVRIGCCLHVTSETANLLLTLKDGGAELALCASNPLSTQDDVASCLVEDYGIPVFAIKGEDGDTYYNHICRVLSIKPHILIDDGADLIGTLHRIRMKDLEGLQKSVKEWLFQTKEEELEGLFSNILGGLEETTTGVIRLRSMERDGLLLFPIIAVNDALTKHMFDNRYGTGQSTIDGILRATNILFAGKIVVVCGYGWCGKGIAQRSRGLNAKVIVTEVDPLKALEALMDGFYVMDMESAAKIGDIFITATGDIRVIREEHFKLMKDGAIVGNAGHFNVEIDINALEKMKKKKSKIREALEEYTLKDGKKIYLLCEGRLVNLSAAEGHPSEVMDMSFSNQALCAEYLLRKGREMEKKVYPVPIEIDREVARLKLECEGVKIDKLTEEQDRYLRTWQLGT